MCQLPHHERDKYNVNWLGPKWNSWIWGKVAIPETEKKKEKEEKNKYKRKKGKEKKKEKGLQGQPTIRCWEGKGGDYVESHNKAIGIAVAAAHSQVDSVASCV